MEVGSNHVSRKSAEPVDERAKAQIPYGDGVGEAEVRKYRLRVCERAGEFINGHQQGVLDLEYLGRGHQRDGGGYIDQD